MPPSAELPSELWLEILARGGPLRLAARLRGVCVREAAARRLQRAWHATEAAIPPRWRHGAVVRVRTAPGTWERGQMFRSLFSAGREPTKTLWGIDFFDHHPRRRYRFYLEGEGRARMRKDPGPSPARRRLLCSPPRLRPLEDDE